MDRAAVVAMACAVWSCDAGSASPAPASAVAPKQQGARVAPVVPRDAGVDADVSRLAGEPLYMALCAPCHAADGSGYAADRAPSLVNPTFVESASDEFLRRSIAAGRPGTSMAAYGKAFGGPLDDAGVDRLVDHLRQLGGPSRSTGARRGGRAIASAPGDAAAGAAIYTQRCLTCHGDARSRGEAPSLANPQFLAAASDAFIRHAIVHGRPGTKMEAFGHVLTAAEIDGVVSYVRALGNAGPPKVTLLPPPTGREPLVLHPGGGAPKFSPRAEPCPPGAPPTCKPEPRYVSVEQVGQALAARRRMVIIDARPPSDWRRSHIAGAVSIPYHEMSRLSELPRDGTWVIAYCACPHHLSGIVVDELRKRGHRNAVILDEGINEWQRRGLPMVVGDGVTASPAPPPSPPSGR